MNGEQSVKLLTIKKRAYVNRPSGCKSPPDYFSDGPPDRPKDRKGGGENSEHKYAVQPHSVRIWCPVIQEHHCRKAEPDQYGSLQPK